VHFFSLNTVEIGALYYDYMNRIWTTTCGALQFIPDPTSPG